MIGPREGEFKKVCELPGENAQIAARHDPVALDTTPRASRHGDHGELHTPKNRVLGRKNRVTGQKPELQAQKTDFWAQETELRTEQASFWRQQTEFRSNKGAEPMFVT